MPGSKTKDELKNMIRSWDTRKWRKELDTKTSLTVYRQQKIEIQEESCYDNRESSVILYRAFKWRHIL